MKYEIQQCIGSRLRRLSRIVDGYYRKCLSDFDITENQMSILFALSKLGEVEQGEIGKKLVLERSSVSRSVRLLEKQGLIMRTTLYRPKIKLTEKGQALVDTLLPLWEKTMDELNNKIGAVGMKQIEALEKRLG